MERCRNLRKESDELEALLQKLIDSRLCERELCRMCDLIMDVALTQYRKCARNRRWQLKSLGVSIEDMAIDAMGELLASHNVDQCARLKTALSDHRNADGSISLVDRLASVVSVTIKRSIHSLQCAYDPVYMKLLRTLHEYVQRAEDLAVLTSYMGRVYCRKSVGLRYNTPVMSYEELNRLLPRLCTNSKKVGAPNSPVVEMLNMCLEAVNSQTEYRNAVPERHLMRLTVHYISTMSYYENKDYMVQERADITPDMQKATDDAFRRIEILINTNYINRGKMSCVIGREILSALKKYIQDACYGDPLPPIEYIDGSMLGRIRDEHSRQFKYIISMFKSFLRQNLVE